MSLTFFGLQVTYVYFLSPEVIK